MSSYNIFAEFYDELTVDVDYKVRSDYISDFFYTNELKSGNILDVACGTGSLSILLSDKGYNVTGLDLSQEMLCVADSKANGRVSFVKTDMTDFCFNQKFDGCVCSLDSINHLVSAEDVKRCFSCVHSSLKENGIFVFDVNTPYKHNFILNNNTFVYDEENYFLSWDNENLGNNIIRILLDFFVFNGKSYDRFSEEFCERAYSTDELIKLLDGFEIINIYDDLTLNAPNNESERLYFVCRRK